MLDDLRQLLGPCVPNDHSRQVVSEYYVYQLLKRSEVMWTVLDLGCGNGNSVDLFRKRTDNVKWIGLDVDSSPEVVSRTRTDAEFVNYDGVQMPFRDNTFDLVYCNQVLEHVAKPAETLREVHRVLKPGGFFAGSTSQLEPYHSYSTWNFTVFGFFRLLHEAGLLILELRPSIDAPTLITRRLLRRPRFFRIFWRRESPLNMIIGVAGKTMRKSNASINLAKLLFCGQFCFLASKPLLT